MPESLVVSPFISTYRLLRKPVQSSYPGTTATPASLLFVTFNCADSFHLITFLYLSDRIRFGFEPIASASPCVVSHSTSTLRGLLSNSPSCGSSDLLHCIERNANYKPLASQLRLSEQVRSSCNVRSFFRNTERSAVVSLGST